MDYKEAKDKYIQAWGTLGNNWGISKAMAQIHALLLISPEPLSTDEIMEELEISRGNANINLRNLINWGIIYKIHKPTDRKEYFIAEKDVWKTAKMVMIERRKRELYPALQMFNEVKDVQVDDSAEQQEFKKMTKELARFANTSDDILHTFIKSEESWIFKTFLKFLSK